MINFIKAYSSIGVSRTEQEIRDILSSLKSLIINNDSIKDNFTKGAGREFIAIDITTEGQNYFYTLVLQRKSIYAETLLINGEDVMFRDSAFNQLLPDLRTKAADEKFYISLHGTSFLYLPNSIEMLTIKPLIDYLKNLDTEKCELPQLCLADRY